MLLLNDWINHGLILINVHLLLELFSNSTRIIPWGILLRNIFSKAIQAVHCITCVYQSWHILSNCLLFLMQIYSLIAHFYFTYLNDFNFYFSNLFYEHSLMNVPSYEHERASCWVLLTIIGWVFSQGSFPFGCIFPMFFVTFIDIWSNLYFLLACFGSAAPGAGLSEDKLRLAG